METDPINMYDANVIKLADADAGVLDMQTAGAAAAAKDRMKGDEALPLTQVERLTAGLALRIFCAGRPTSRVPLAATSRSASSMVSRRRQRSSNAPMA